MKDPLEQLRDLISDSLEWIWSDFAEEGTESAILRPLGQYPKPAAWIAESLAMCDDYICRKLGAMLVGWIFEPNQSRLLAGMLDREREVYSSNPLEANSVAEDIMFSATRWTTCNVRELNEAGILILSTMVRDAMKDVPWNTVHWAAANLYAVTGPRHPILIELTEVPAETFGDQRFLLRTAEAIRSGDHEVLEGYHTEPSARFDLASDHPRFQDASEIWDAASKAQAAQEL